jgi:hypothetical protein
LGSKQPHEPEEGERLPARQNPVYPNLNIGDSLPPEASILGSADSLVISRKSTAQLAHDQEMEKLKEVNKQETDRSKEDYRRKVDTRNWWTGIVVTGVISVVGCFVMFLPGSTDDTKKWVFGYLFAIFTYWMGFKGGSAGKEPPKSNE